MFTRFQQLRAKGSDEGFTLIELLVVIIIIGILAAIAIPVFLNQRNKGYDSAVESDLRNAATAQETYLTSSAGGYTNLIADLQSNGFKFSATSNYQGGAVPTDATFFGNALGAQTYCMIGQSASGNYFSYGSVSGLVNAGATAPTCTQ